LIVLLLTSALLVSTVSVVAPPRKAYAGALSVVFSPTSGRYGNATTFVASGATVADGTTCSFSGAPTSVVTSFQGKVYGGKAYGSFVVGTGPSGAGGAAYHVTITCGVDAGTADFTVNPSITISPWVGLAGNTVSVAVYGLPSDTVGPCTITSSGATQVVASSPQSCSLGSGTATGTFTVNSAASDGTYTIYVNYSGGSTSGTYKKVTTPNVLISMYPTSAPPGWGTVSITGGGFNKPAGARSCSFNSTHAGILPPADMVSKTCTISADGTLTAGFVVASSAVGGVDTGTIYINDASTTGGPFLVGTFWVNATASHIPSITPSMSGVAGNIRSISNPTVTKLSRLDAGACSISSIPTMLISSPFCVIDNSGNILNATFVVSSLAPGQNYNVTVTGSHGDTASLGAGLFAVTPAVTVNPTRGSPPVASLPGTTVTVSGTGFKTDTDGCKLNSTSPPPHRPDIVGSSYSCTVTGSTGVLSATFVVLAGALNYTSAYQLQVNGTRSGVMNEASPLYAPFYVVPRIVLNPTSGVSGQTIAVLGTGFNSSTPASAANCRFIQAWQAGFLVPSPFSASSCTVSTTGTVTGSFTVAPTLANGVYTILVAGISSSKYDNATATFTKGVPVTLTISPSSGFTGTGPVSVTGTFTSADAGACTIVAPAGSNLFSGVPSPTCTISSSGALTASFTVSTTAQGGTWAVQVYGAGGGFATGNFGVTPKMTLTPASGESFAAITITGSGFSAADAGAGCATTLFSTPPGLLSGVSCSISATTFQMTGSFSVAGIPPLPGSYTVTFPSSLGPVSAPTFTKSASAFTLLPNYGPVGTVVSVHATGFPVGDVSPCSITAVPDIIGSMTCTVSGGVVDGSFTVKSGSVPGISSVKVTTTPSGTFKSAPFQVNPTISLSPSSGGAGTLVTISGSNFAAGDSGCAITSSPIGLISGPSCVVVGGVMSGLFTVASASSGNYTVYVTGTTGDAGQAKFSAPLAPTLTLSPISGPSGTPVNASGSHFLGAICTMTSTPSGLFTSASCSLSGGILSGGFTVAPGASGAYTVTAMSNLGPLDSATFPFTATGTTTTTTTATSSTTVASFTMSASPGTLTINPGGVGTTTITVQSIGGFNSPVTLAVPTLPSGVSGVLSTNPVTPPAGSSVTSVLTLAVSSAAPGGTTVIAVTGTAGTLTGSASVMLIIPTTTGTTSTTSTATITTATGPWVPPKCVIATATFGSEVSPAVQFLRNFRDRLVLSTTAGSAFMQVFNAWYYSFSPSVAQFIASNDPIRAPIRVMLYPLLGVLGLGSLVYSLFSATPEFAIVVAGLVASSLIGLVYLTLPAMLAVKRLSKRKAISVSIIGKGSLALLVTALAMLAAGELAGSFVLLAIGSSVLVLTCIVTVPVLAALAILRPIQK